MDTFTTTHGEASNMNPVEQLLADLQAGEIADAEALNARLAALTDEEVGTFEAEANAILDAIVDRTAELPEGTDRLAALETAAAAIEASRAEAQRRMDAAEASAEAERAIVERIRPVAETEPAEVPEPEAAPETPAEGDEGETVEPEEAAAPVAEAEPVAVPASAARPRLTRLAGRQPVERVATLREAAHNVVITAAAEVPGFAAGAPIDNFESLTAALSARAEGIRRISIPDGAAPVSYHVATIRSDYPEDQDLRSFQHNGEAVDRAITAAIGQRSERMTALSAAGGFCAPAVPIYDQLAIGSDARPARQALPTFQASRGRVTYMPSPVWTDFASGVRFWTSTNDVEALTNPNVRKPCVRVDCDDPVDAEVYAIAVCLTVGNFYNMTYGERRDAIMQDLMTWQARVAERKLLTLIAGASTNVSTGQTLGTLSDFLAILDRAAAGFESRFRTDDNYRLELWSPRWLKRNMRTDMVRTPGIAGASLAETLALADATIETAIAARGFNVTWLWDGEDGGTDQEFGAEAGGSLQNWPTRAINYVFHPGAHRFLDAGEINIGIQRDSTLNRSNDLELWSESLEGVMSPGLESLRIDMDVCPSGERSAPVDATGALCTTGS